MIFRAFDIETIPDALAWSGDKVTYKMVPGPLPCPSSSGRLPSVRLEEVSSFPPPHAHRVVAISYVDISFEAGRLSSYRFEGCGTDCRWSRDGAGDVEERALLSVWGQGMESRADIHLVTWNGRTFDLPVIVLRSFRHRIPCAWYYRTKDVRYRYSTEGHCDLMDFLADYGAGRPMKLHDACRLWGLPGKTDMSGASVEGEYLSTVRDPKVDASVVQAKVASYCLQDSIQTALLFVASRYLVGKVVAESYDATVDTFASSATVNDVITLDWAGLKLGGRT